MIFRYNIEETIRVKDYFKKIHLPSNVITDVKERGQILVNDQNVTNAYLMHEGDLLEVVFPPTHQGENIISIKGDFEIVYEDSYLLVLNKESGIATIPTRKHYENSLANYVMSYYKRMGIEANIHFVSRLDAPTSGLIMLAKNSYVLTLLKDAGIIKKYMLEVIGHMDKTNGIIECGIIKEEGSIIKRTITNEFINSKTIYEVKGENKKNSLVLATLCTGKTHQLRLHFSSSGCPIVGDELYGTKTKDGILHLHSCYLEFVHPITKEKIILKSSPKWLIPDWESIEI